MILIETERLNLKLLSENDASFILELVNTPLWLQWIGSRNVNNKEDAVRYLVQGPLKSYADFGYGLFLVELKSLNIPIGLCGLVKRNELDGPDLGFAFLPSYIEKGFGFEIAKATLDYVKEKFRLEKIYAVSLAENKRSIHLLSKLSFTYISSISLPSSTEPLSLYQYKIID
jgi:RimJ/RimL family protein N-acetyltransferase